jgi:hypothetical protein
VRAQLCVCCCVVLSRFGCHQSILTCIRIPRVVWFDLRSSCWQLHGVLWRALCCRSRLFTHMCPQALLHTAFVNPLRHCWHSSLHPGARCVVSPLCVLCLAAARGMDALFDCVLVCYARATHATQHLLSQHIAALICGHLFAPALRLLALTTRASLLCAVFRR